jgi:hypothetical protein
MNRVPAHGLLVLWIVLHQINRREAIQTSFSATHRYDVDGCLGGRVVG